MPKQKGVYAEAWKIGVEIGKANIQTKKTVAERLRTIRIQRGMTQKQVADMARINQTTYSGYENEISQPTIAVLIRIADIYSISLDYLAGRTENIFGLYAKDNEQENSTDSKEIKERMTKLEEQVKQLKEKIN